MADIEKRGENSYRLTVSCGHDTTGKPIRKRKTIDLSHIKPSKQKAEAEKQYFLFKNQVENGMYMDAGKITFEDFAIKWLKDYGEANLAPKTLFSYQELLFKRIIPAIGHNKLNKLQPPHLIEFYNNLREEGIRQDQKYKPKENFTDLLAGIDLTLKALSSEAKLSDWSIKSLKSRRNVSATIAEQVSVAARVKIQVLFDVERKPRGLSERTILYHHRIISSILTSAVQWQFILSNPAARVKPPKVEKKETIHLDFDQTEYIFRLVDQEPLKYRTALYLAIFGGMRAGELNALEWKDIDWDNNSVKINKASQYLPDRGTFTKDPKNHSSERVISLHSIAMSALREYKLWQNGVRATMENLWVDTDRIFTKSNGEEIFPHTIGKWFSKFITKHNESVMKDESIPQKEKNDYILDKVSLHGLRHTCATLMIGQNVDIATVSKRLGHADISTTLNIYTHALKKLDTTASDKLGDLFSKQDKKDLKQG
jgi:integrase